MVRRVYRWNELTVVCVCDDEDEEDEDKVNVQDTDYSEDEDAAELSYRAGLYDMYLCVCVCPQCESAVLYNPV